MERPAFGSVLVGWLCAAGAAFVALLGIRATGDHAGWIPVIAIAQLPAFLVIRKAPSGAPLAGAARWGVALPAALVAGMAVFWIAVPIGSSIWKPAFLEFRPLLLGLMAGLVATIAAGVRFGRRLEDARHPHGTRRVLLVVTALGAAGLGAMAVRFGVPAREPAAWLGVGVPVLWAVPLWILLALERRPESPIPRVIVTK